MTKRKLILDMDTGIDDAFALCYAMSHPGVELVGCTGTYGNVYTPDGARNTRNILDFFGRYEVPVYEGEFHSLTHSFERRPGSIRVHGENGTGGVELPASGKPVEEESAVSFIARSIEKLGKDLTIVTTGPMTNLGKVFSERPELATQVGLVVSMGGALTVSGNTTPFAEANLHQDPEAAKLVMESGCPFILVGLDVTKRCRLSKKDARNMRELGTESGKLFSAMLDYYIDHTTGNDDTYIHDPSAVICALYPEFFTKLESQLTVLTEGDARGKTIVDGDRLLEKSNTSACIQVEAQLVEKELLTNLRRLFLTR